MKRKLYLIALLLSIAVITGYDSLAQEENELNFPISDIER